MNKVSKVSKIALMLSSLAAFAPVASQAKTLEQAYLESCNKASDRPVPVTVVSPRVDSSEVGNSVEVEFTVDTKGDPSEVSVKSSPDDDLASAVVDAVKQWRFTPAMRNGEPVATKVVLPVRIVEADTEQSSLALN